MDESITVSSNRKFVMMSLPKGNTSLRRKSVGIGSRWLPAIVEEITGPVSCLVKLEDNRLIRRHFDHIIHSRHESTSLVESDPAVQEVEEDFEEVPI